MNHLPVASRALVLVLSAVLYGTGLTGCGTLQPESLSTSEIAAATAADKESLRANVEPLAGPLTLEDAIARAIKYNAERRLRAMEEAVAAGTLEVGNYDMLPKLVASAGYQERSNDLTTRSRDSVTGAPSLANPFISSSRAASTTSLAFSWSLLDFGQSYYAARQNADRVLIAAEHRRKSLHNLVQDVRTAYWRMVAAQKLVTTLRSTIVEAESALDDARQSEREGLRSPVEPLRYQRQVLENLRLLETIEQELSTARIELSSLINLPLAADAKVVEPAAAINTAWLNVAIEQMEEQALLRNPDLRESLYNARIARQETQRTLLKLFPGLSFNYAVKGSNDSFLINQNWNEAGAQISLNLFGLLSAPAQMRLAEAGVQLADQKRMTTQMAVLTQMHIARLQYANAAHQFERAEAIAAVDARLAQHIANQEKAEKQTKLDRVAQQTATILSQLRRYQALSNAHAAAAKLQATLGLEPQIDAPGNTPLAELSATVAQSMLAWNTGAAALLAAGTAAPQNPPAAAARHVEAPAVALPQAVRPALPEPALALSAALATPPTTASAPPSATAAAQVAAEVQAWAKAQSQCDIDTYLAYYADEFRPANGIARSAWNKARRAAIACAAAAQVEVVNLTASAIGDDRVVTRFEERRSGARQPGAVLKHIWTKTNGKWRIAVETASHPSPSI